MPFCGTWIGNPAQDLDASVFCAQSHRCAVPNQDFLSYELYDHHIEEDATLFLKQLDSSHHFVALGLSKGSLCATYQLP